MPADPISTAGWLLIDPQVKLIQASSQSQQQIGKSNTVICK